MRRTHTPEPPGHGTTYVVDLAIAAGLTLLAALLRYDALAPSSLWIDDAWAALIVKAHTTHDFLLAGVTAPGFALVLKGWLHVFGFSELNAQLVPFAIGVLTPPGIYFVARWRGVGRLGASVGALVLVASVVHMTYSTRVKQYTLDGFVALLLLAVAWWLVQDVGNRRRWWFFVLTCVVGIMLSSPVIAVAVSSTSVAIALLILERSPLRVALVPVGLLALFTGLWWWLLLRPRVNDALADYWSGYFIPHDRGVGRALFIAARDLKDVFAGAVPPNFTAATLASLAVPASVAVLLVCRRFRVAFLFVIAPLLVALALAAAHAVPLGTGRTDIYLYAGLALAIAVAVDELQRRWKRVTVAALVLVLGVQVVTFKPAVPYPTRDVRPLVAELERRISPSDSVLVRAYDDFAFGLYTTEPITFVRSSASTGFGVRVDGPRIHYPLIVPTGPDLRTESWETAIAKAKADSTHVWLLTGGADPISTRNARDPYVRRLMRNAGLLLQLEILRPGANLTLWSSSPELVSSETPELRRAPSRYRGSHARLGIPVVLVDG